MSAATAPIHTEPPITIFDNVASNNPDAAYALLKKYGRPEKSKTKQELALKLVKLFKDKGNPAFAEIMELHPDKVIFEEIYAEAAGRHEPPAPKPTAPEAPAPKQFNNACGCALGADGEKSDATEYSNCAGNPNCNCSKSGPAKAAAQPVSAAPALAADGDTTKLPHKEGFYTPTNIIIISGFLLLGTIIFFTTTNGRKA